ncbi:MAG: class I SAM-dependent methyltransferase [Saprospiraceae bacterium]|nr:class I SAM-dependent methyltransferase [Saprospiraceae bacterium]
MSQIISLLGNTDIYLLDQIMKGRYSPSDIILDAGAGGGRNLHWFVQQGFRVFGADRNPAVIQALKQNYPGLPDESFQEAPVESLPFPDAAFNHIICCAVLHFAENERHFEQMFGELVRVLRPGGSIFIRVATDDGLSDKMIPLGNGRFHLPDGTDRFLMTRKVLDLLLHQHQLRLLEPFKTVLVDDLRSMAVLVLGK